MCRTKIIPNDCGMYYNESEWKVMKDEIIEKENKLANLLDVGGSRAKVGLVLAIPDIFKEELEEKFEKVRQ